MELIVRKWFGIIEETHHDTGPAADVPLRKAVAAVVVANPFAGRHEPDLQFLIDQGPALGTELGRRAADLLGAPVLGYGKGGIAGVAGEQEHVVACLTTVFGDALREAVGGAEAWISSATKVGSAGEPLDLPLAYKDALFVREFYDAITLRIPDAPRPDELLLAVGVASRGRVHHRVGGLARHEVKGGGLR